MMTERKLVSGPAKTAILGVSKEIKFDRSGGRTKQQQEGK
jgi:hypothetical protein